MLRSLRATASRAISGWRLTVTSTMCAGRLILAPQFRLQPESSHTRRHTLCSLDRANESSAHLQARAGAHPPPTHAAAQVSDFAGPQLPLSFAFSHLPCSSDRESPLSDGHGVAARRDAPRRRPPAGDRRRTRRHLRVLRAAPERRSQASSSAPALAAAQHSVDLPRPAPPCQCMGQGTRRVTISLSASASRC